MICRLLLPRIPKIELLSSSSFFSLCYVVGSGDFEGSALKDCQSFVIFGSRVRSGP
jgi:hypothetical protein